MEKPNGNSWLVPSTKSARDNSPPQKATPATIVSFAVVILSLGAVANHVWQVGAIQKALGVSRADAALQLNRTPPFVIARELALSNAMTAQFELSCADIVSIFLSDQIVTNGEPGYLAALYRDMMYADEFRVVTVRVCLIPDGNAGRAFSDQFIEPTERKLPSEFTAMHKKARIMLHWAKRIGAVVQVVSKT